MAIFVVLCENFVFFMVCLLCSCFHMPVDSSVICVFAYDLSFTVLRWRCVVDRTLKSNYYYYLVQSSLLTSIMACYSFQIQILHAACLIFRIYKHNMALGYLCAVQVHSVRFFMGKKIPRPFMVCWYLQVCTLTKILKNERFWGMWLFIYYKVYWTMRKWNKIILHWKKKKKCSYLWLLF